MEDCSCVPMCSLCAMPEHLATSRFKKCGACKTRTYCSKKCQIQDWKIGKHRQFCGALVHGNTKHQPFCAYLDRNPQLDNDCLVETNKIKSNPREVITTGMNTCFFVAVKTKKEIIGWHASLQSDFSAARRKFKSIAKSEFVSAFLVPGEDRDPETLDLKPTCRQMRLIPFTDPSISRRTILDFLEQFDWYAFLEVMPPVNSYKDFVVFDMVHKQPHTFSDEAQFDEGCAFDAGVANVPLGFF